MKKIEQVLYDYRQAESELIALRKPFDDFREVLMNTVNNVRYENKLAGFTPDLTTLTQQAEITLKFLERYKPAFAALQTEMDRVEKWSREVIEGEAVIRLREGGRKLAK